METIVNSLTKLKGVHHACIYQDGKQLASTFPDDEAATAMAEEIIEQIFAVLLAIERSYNEIYFSIGEKILAAFLMHDNHIVLLVTDKKINFPLITMGVKSASTKIRLKIEEKKSNLLVAMPAANNVAQPATNHMVVPFLPETNPEFEPVLEQLSLKLINYLGPAAPFVLDDSLKQWKQKYVQTRENLPHLIEFIREELDSDTDKNEFSNVANNIIERTTNT